MKNRKLILLRNLAILIVSLLFLTAGAGCIYADQLLNKINYTQPGSAAGADSGSAGIYDPGDTEPNDSTAAGLIGGLYHDDAIKNILLLGSDDYQKNDTGRSDSMMLVSIDTRHKKLKITSFMRDMYVAIPGIGSDKLNAAYSRGGGRAKGAQKVVSTIEANFGIDIDRFVIVEFSAFPKIINRLGGVTITLTSGEAKLINRYSESKKKNLTAGTFTLDGYQARYYSRIRAIGDDFERTQRQRKVFSSLVDKLKSSSLFQINSILSDTLNLVTTNMTKNEIVSLASHSLTYLNYPVSQHRVPADGEYKAGNVYIGKSTRPSDVLIVNLDKCRESLTKFLYENNIPEKTYG